MAAVNPTTKNLVSWWKLDETSGTRYDAHGSHDLADHNTVGYDTGKKGNCAVFVKANSEYLSAADHADYSFADVDFSVGGWIKTTTTAVSGINNAKSYIGKWNYGANQREWELFAYDTNNFKFRVTNDGTSTGTILTGGAWVVDTWYFVVGVHDSANNKLRLYTNTTEYSADYSAGCRDGTSSLTFGANNEGASYKADAHLDEMFIFNKALSADEVSWLYNSGNGRTYEDLLLPPKIKTVNGVDIVKVKTINGVDINKVKSIWGIQ